MEEPEAAGPRNSLVDHLSALRAFAMSLTRNRAAADDLVQDTLLKACTHIERFTPGTNMRAWLFSILRNTYYSSLRKHAREVDDPDGLLAQNLCVKPDHDGRLTYTDFLVAFEKLSSEHREVLTLVGAEGFSCEEAAATIGVSVGTIKSRTCRARKQLCELMGLRAGESPLCAGNDTLAAMGLNAAP